MKRRLLLLAVVLLVWPAPAQRLSVTESVHDLSPDGPGSVKGASGYACLFCHAPHNVLDDQTPLWNHELSSQLYTPYSSSTYHQSGQQPLYGTSTKLCLSCHDGTIAPGQTIASGYIPMSGSMRSSATFGSDLRSSHPVSIPAPFADNGGLNPQLLASPPGTGDPSVRLPQNRLECTTCHEPHTPNLDPVVTKFLVRDSSQGQLCLVCHDPSRPTATSLGGWRTGKHAVASHTTGGNPALGGYATVAANACMSCHSAHNSGLSGRILRQSEEAACAACHTGANLNPPLPDVMGSFARSQFRHPVELAALHDPAENFAPLNSSRHAECADCHNAHAAGGGGASLPPASPSALVGATGVSASDGVTPLRPAAAEYEVCFKCHANSANKPQSPSFTAFGRTPYRENYAQLADPYNVRLNFQSQVARHNVLQPARSGISPSLRGNMLDLNGVASGRSLAVGTYIYCTDCHNSDVARNVGGSGANGPHGSAYNHLLERRYEFEPVPASPGGSAVGVSYSPGMLGPYALCDKCHDVDNQIIRNDPVFRRHELHVVDKRTSCATCHAPHGIQGGSTITNGRLINFDTRIVGPNSNGVLRMDTAARTCSLRCHGEDHSNERY
jgi:predicted CXXCH cytochrome family protein